MKLAIIVNPRAGRGRAWRKLRRHLKKWSRQNWEVEVHLTSCSGHAGVIAQDLLENPPDLLVVCGGDGTLNEIVTLAPDPPFPIGLIPAGTANVLARELGLPLDPVQALDVSLTGTVRRVDLGILTGRSAYRFLLMAGIGFDARVIWKSSQRLKNMFGVLAYYQSAIQSLLTYSFPVFQVETEGEHFSTAACIVANARGYGGGLVLTPEADISDGMLDIVALEGGTRLEYAKFVFSAWRGRPGTYPWVKRARTKAVRAEGPRGIWAQVDGELAGTLPLEIGVVPASFPLMVPSSWK